MHGDKWTAVGQGVKLKYAKYLKTRHFGVQKELPYSRFVALFIPRIRGQNKGSEYGVTHLVSHRRHWACGRSRRGSVAQTNPMNIACKICPLLDDPHL